MSKLNLLVHIGMYEDSNPTNNPTKNLAKWTYDEQALDAAEPYSKSLKLQAGQTLELFSGVVDISDDNTTTYDIAPKPDSGNTYVLSHNDGTAPEFRDARTTGADATTTVTATKNGPIMTFASTSGTALALILGGCIVGDEARLGEGFALGNQGKYKLLALTATSFQVENSSGVAETVVLGSDFADDLQIFSSAGVQVGDKVKLLSGFSSVSLDTYEITDVNPDYMELYSIRSLPTESDILTQLFIYNSSKNFIYIESDKRLDISLNGVSVGEIDTLKAGTKTKKGMLLKSGESFSASITNKSSDVASIFYCTLE